MKKALPPSWAWVPLADLGHWYGGGTPSKSNPAFWENGTIPWVSPKDMKVLRVRDSEDHITPEAVEQSATNLIPSGAVLVVTRSGILRHSLPVAVTETPVTINQDLKALVPHSGIESDYVAYALQAFESEILSKTTKGGTTVQSIETSQLQRLKVPLAPSAEQKRIIREIEKQTSRIDSAIVLLRRAQDNLARYRSSVFKAACEGRLVTTEAELARTEGRGYESAGQLLLGVAEKRRDIWRDRNGTDKLYAEPKSPTASNRPVLPAGWAWVTWEQIGFCQNGRAFPSSNYQAEGVKLLRPGNLCADGTVVWDAENTRRLPEFWADRHPEHVVGPGELIINLTAQSLKDEFLGRVCLTGAEERCLLNQRLARLTPVEVSPRYLLWLFKAPVFRRFVDELNKGSLIQHMFTSQIQRFCFPLPPLAEQVRIADEIERQSSILRTVTAAIAREIVRSGVLRQAILQSAFEGKLVRQEASDEPASILLEQIRKSGEEQESKGNRRKHTQTATPRRGTGIKPGVSTPGTGTETNPKPRRGAGSVHEFAYAPSELPDLSYGHSLGLKPQALRPGPVGAEEDRGLVTVPAPTDGETGFLDLPRDAQIDLVWESLLGRGALEKDEAIRITAQLLRDKGLAQFQRLRQGGSLYQAIATALDRGVREGSLDRPRRGYVRALLTDPKDYSQDEWRLCLLSSLDHEAVHEDDALRAAAEWARETMGLEFVRLREEGMILRSLRPVLEEAVRKGEVTRKRGVIFKGGSR